MTTSTTYNNFHINHATIGAVNTGNVHSIDASVTTLGNTGNDKAVDALKSFSQAVLDDSSITTDEKNDLLEHLALLGEQSTAPAGSKKLALVKTSLGAITQGVSLVGTLATAWQSAEPALRGLFGF